MPKLNRIKPIFAQPHVRLMWKSKRSGVRIPSWVCSPWCEAPTYAFCAWTDLNPWVYVMFMELERIKFSIRKKNFTCILRGERGQREFLVLHVYYMIILMWYYKLIKITYLNFFLLNPKNNGILLVHNVSIVTYCTRYYQFFLILFELKQDSSIGLNPRFVSWS